MIKSNFRPVPLPVLLLTIPVLLFGIGCDNSTISPRKGATILDIEPDSVTLARSDSAQVKAIPRDPQGDVVSGYEITWETEDDSVATVDTAGTVLARHSGVTTIAVTAEKKGLDSLVGQSTIAVERLQGGRLRVSASTSGDDVDRDGYSIVVDDSTSRDIGPNGTATFSGLEEGEPEVQLGAIASNCAVEGTNPRTVLVRADSTVSTTFDVSCTATGSNQAVEIPSQSDFTDQGVILEPGSCGEWDWWFTNIVGAARLGDTLYLYYQAADGDRPNGQCSDSDLGSPHNRFMGVATSTDNRTFTKWSANPIFKHQPSGGISARLSGEGGTLLGATFQEADGLIRLYVGGMEELSVEQVDSDLVHVKTTDGTTLTNQSDAGKSGSGIWPYGDESFPAAVTKVDSTYYLYYTGQGGGARNWTLHVLSGPDPTDLNSQTPTQVQGLSDGDAQGQQAGAIRLSDSQILVAINDAFAGTDATIDLRTAPTSDPTDLTTLEDTWDFSREVVVPKLFLDREAGEWLLFYQRGKGHDRPIRLKTAPISYQ